MNRTPRWLSALIGGAALLAASAVQALTLPGPLVDVPWLKAHQAEVQVVDLRDNLNSLTEKPKYETVAGKPVLEQVGGHIPDALSVNFWGLRTKRNIAGKEIDYQMLSAAEFQARMRGVQLEPGKPIVVTPTGDDATSLQEAAYFVWMLQVYGVPPEQIAILNGGVRAWIMAGGEIDTDAIAPMGQSNWTAQSARAGMVASREQLQAALKAKKPVFDTRPITQYLGLDAVPAIPKRGRIAGTEPIAAEWLYEQAADGSWRYLSAEKYRAIFSLPGIVRPRPGIVFCNTGQYAAGAWFVLERVLGMKGVAMFPGGFYEWVMLGLPVDER
ncbi:thiosulfate/3-mercaptopyruvate sulfurtransferase [Tibeticola sediminis]|jgi:thiosulfate/3-mercaptopyruvate sulfurtransferase|uniref:Sulfurtransferase n=1 Tax=Tibeticola sediminis TaxID=1917811 RepID=A0A3N4UD28_9BURK|nr:MULTISPECIES: rhodanese-like domain-containing protein [Tibeticola]MCI4440498.1 rhodanese [Tibeticola sp.]RPE67738.1 thiosulfate/3-mercaptopyruvate sulfurtransferase [Tibeticola sediminis]